MVCIVGAIIVLASRRASSSVQVSGLLGLSALGSFFSNLFWEISFEVVMGRDNLCSLPSLSHSLVLRAIVEQYYQNVMILTLVCLYSSRTMGCHPTIFTQIHRAAVCDEVSFGISSPRIGGVADWYPGAVEIHLACGSLSHPMLLQILQ